MNHLDILVHAAYSLLLISFLMRDILWLRMLYAMSLLLLIPYFYFQPRPMWAPVGWELAILAVNVYWIARLSIERRPARFTPEEKRLYDAVLHTLSPYHARNLFDAARWSDIEGGKTVATQGQPLNTLSLVSGGGLKLEKDGFDVEQIGEGRFLGSYTFLRNTKDPLCPVSFVTTEPTRLAVWDNTKLRELIEGDIELSRAVEAVLGLELAKNLVHARDALELELKAHHPARLAS